MKKIHKKIIFYFFILLYFSLFVFSHSLLFAQSNAGLPGEFLRQGAGSRAFIFGSSFIAIADDPSTAIWNPAGLLQINQLQFDVMHARLFYETKYQYGSIVGHTNRWGLGNFNFGFSTIHLGLTGLERRDEFNHPFGAFNYMENGYFGSAAYGGVNDYLNWSAGFSIIGVNHVIEAENNWTGGFKIGGLIQPLAIGNLKFWAPFRLGITYMAIHKNKNDAYPSNLDVALSRAFHFWKNRIFCLSSAGLTAVKYDNITSTAMSGGGELAIHFYKSTFFLRIGKSNHFNVGFGVQSYFLPLQSFGIQRTQIDFTTQCAGRNSGLGNASFMTFSLAFGPPEYDLAYKNKDQISKFTKKQLLKQLSRFPFDLNLSDNYPGTNKTIEDIYKDEIADTLEIIAGNKNKIKLAIRYSDFAGSLLRWNKRYVSVIKETYSLKKTGKFDKIVPEISKNMPPLIKAYQQGKKYFKRRKASVLNYFGSLLLCDQFGRQKKGTYQENIQSLLDGTDNIQFSEICKTFKSPQKERLLFLKAIAYEKTKRYEKAIEQWQKLEDNKDDVNVALYHEIVLFLKSGNYESAGKKLKKLSQIGQYSVPDREELGLFPIQSDNSIKDDYWFLKGYSEFLKNRNVTLDTTGRKKIVNDYAKITSFLPVSNLGEFLHRPLKTGNVFKNFLHYVDGGNGAVFTHTFDAYFRAFQEGLITDKTLIENYQSKK